MGSPKCTYCGGTTFYEGPSGGAATNLLCANEKCRHWFNFSPFGMEDLKRVEPTAEEKTKAQSEHRAQLDAERLARHQQGRKAFEDGKLLDSVRTSKPYGGYSEASDNIDRIAGFIDALCEQVRGHPRDETLADTLTVLAPIRESKDDIQ